MSLRSVISFWILGWLLLGCYHEPSDSLQRRGCALCRELANELQGIHTKEELKAKVPKLRKKWLLLADLLADVRLFLQESPNYEKTRFETEESDALFAELERLFELPGGRELIELSQREAVLRLR